MALVGRILPLQVNDGGLIPSCRPWCVTSMSDENPLEQEVSSMPEPDCSGSLRSRHIIFCLTLLAGIALAYYLSLVQAINLQKIVTGEEASVTFLDVVFLELRYQHNHFCTNIGGHVLFWIGSFLTPGASLFWGRYWKAFEMAFVPPLTFLFFVHRLRLSWQASLFACVCLVFLPGVSAYAWIGIEPGLDMLFGVLALYLAMSPRYGLRTLGSFVMGSGLLVYGGSLMYVPSFYCALIAMGSRRGARSCLLEVLASGVIVAAILVLPFLWWRTGGVIIIGGGSLSFDGAGGRLTDLFSELFAKPASYYFFSSLPAFVHWSAGLIIILAFFLAVRERNYPFWLVMLAAACTLVVYSVAGGVPGFRRALSLNIVMAASLAVVADSLMRRARQSNLSFIVVPALTAIVAVFLFAGWQQWSSYRARVPELPVDYSFLAEQGHDMPAALSPFISGEKDPRVLWAAPEPLRMICMINIMQRRMGRAPTLSDDAIRWYFLNRDTERDN